MRTVPLGIHSAPALNHQILNKNFSLRARVSRTNHLRSPSSPPSSSPLTNPSSKSGICRASQTAELFPSVSPEVVVREARLEDCWEVAETHCSSFFPDYSFPLDLVLRVDRLVALLSGFSVPNGCMRTCLVAVIGSSVDDFLFGSEEFKVGSLEGKLSFNKGSVAGILTVDTVADFLPRKGPLRQRRTGIAYVSNVAVRQRDRRKGIGKQLIIKAETLAKSWGCRAVALHCDANNQAAMRLYLGQGFRTGIAYVSNVAVRQRDRRKGISKQLIIKVETLAKSWGCCAVALHCDANNQAACDYIWARASGASRFLNVQIGLNPKPPQASSSAS